jgi:GT2 family glycosyltransferase
MLIPQISIVLGSYNRHRFLKATIESVRRNGITVPYEIIVIDGGSTDGSVRWLTKQKDVITIVQHNRGEFRGQPIDRKSWGYFMNIVFKAAHGKYILMISDDCLIVPGSVMNGYNQFEDLLKQGRKIGAMAFYWRNWPEMKDYWVGLTLGNKMFVNHGMYLRSALESIGWIDETTYRFYHADGDLCLRLWDAGYEVIDCTTAFVEHFGHVNVSVRRGNRSGQQDDWDRYLKRWENIFYHPEISDNGGWIKLPFDDKSKTVANFPSIARPKGHLAKFLKRIRTSYRNLST